MDDEQLERLVEAVVRELRAAGLVKTPQPVEPEISTRMSFDPIQTTAKSNHRATEPIGELIRTSFIPRTINSDKIDLDLVDPTVPEQRNQPQVAHPLDPEALMALMGSTTSRLGVGRAGPRFTTRSWLLFGADQAITQDTLLRNVDERLLADLGLFRVQTRITVGKEEYLLRPDLGRQLSEDARRIVAEKCVKNPQIQICVGDGLSAQAIESNLTKIMPVLQQGCQAAGLAMGTPFFIQYCRVGVMNDIGDLVKPEVLLLLIGERPGLGRADSMSIYLGYRPHGGQTDADRDVICNIYDGGGTNPLEAGAYAMQYAHKMIRLQASGVKLKMMEQG